MECQGAEYEGWSVKLQSMKDSVSMCKIGRMECQGVR